MNQIKQVKEGQIEIALPHFLISYSDEYGIDNWQEIAVLSANTKDVSDIHLELFDFNIGDEILLMLKAELNFYLFELKNPDPISYLQYHCFTMSNIYSNIHFTYVEGITLSNLDYYINARCKQLGIDFLNRELEDNFAAIISFYLSAVANGKNEFISKLHATEYDYNIRLLQRSLKKLSVMEGLHLEDINYIEICRYINNMKFENYCKLLNLLDNLNIIKNEKQVRSKCMTSLMYFYIVNHKELEDVEIV